MAAELEVAITRAPNERVGRELLFLHALVSAEVAGVAADDAAIEFDDARGHAVEERAVVGDQHHAALEAAQQFFEPGDRIEIEVVGRFVEQQHIGHRDQRLRQRNALLHATGELPDLARAIEVQLRQRGLDTLLPVPRIERFDAGLQRIEVHAFGMLLIRLTNRARFRHALADGFEHAVPGLEDRLLRHIADAHALRHLQQTIVELLQARDDLEHRGFACAVAADQAEALTGFERERSVVEQGHVAEGEVGVGKGKYGHAAIVARPRDAGARAPEQPSIATLEPSGTGRREQQPHRHALDDQTDHVDGRLHHGRR